LGVFVKLGSPSAQTVTKPAAPPQQTVLADASKTPRDDDESLRTLARAEALLDIGRVDAAADMLATLAPEGPHASAARTLQAWALHQAGRNHELLDILGDADEEGDDTVGRIESPELLYLRGAANRAVGHSQAALADLRRLWWGECDGVWGLYALREIVAMPASDGGPYRPVERKVVEHLIATATHRLTRSADNIDPMIAALVARAPRGSLLSAEARHARGVRLLRRERHDEAARELLVALSLAKLPALKRAVARSLGEAERRRGNYTAAMRHFDFVAAGADDHFAHEALALAGQTAIEYRKYPEARKRFEAQLVANPTGMAREQALWGLGWVAFRVGDYSKARQFFRTLFTESEYGPYAAQSLYWGARAAQEIGDRKTADQELSFLTAAFPLDYYAHRAARLTGNDAVSDAMYPSGPIAIDEGVDYVAQLTQAGMANRAMKALPALDAKLTKLGPHELRMLESALHDLNADKWMARVRWQRQSRFPESPEAREVLGRVFPSRIIELARKVTAEQKVSFPLVVALVRQESAFNPRAVSGVGAVGLMQLMIPTARELVREDKRSVLSSDELYDPELNLRIGLKYLGRMLRAFNGRTEYALAAYNAGPGAVTRWRQQQGDLPVDIFVEEIPYEETRAYVRRILAGMRTFTYVEAGGPVAFK
jgi:soluble lytic murein transglycosylase